MVAILTFPSGDAREQSSPALSLCVNRMEKPRVTVATPGRWPFMGMSLLAHALVFLTIVYLSWNRETPLQEQIIELSLVSVAAPESLPSPEPVKTTPVVKSAPQQVKPTPAPAPAEIANVADMTPEETQEQNTEEAEASTPPTPASIAATGDTGEDASTVIHEAKYRHQPPPAYPRRAVELGQQGVVTLHAEVLPSGMPRDLKIVQSSGHRLLDLAALSAVKKWEFEPIAVNGHIATSWVRVPVKFVIQ